MTLTCPRCETRPVCRELSTGWSLGACLQCASAAKALNKRWTEKGMPLSGKPHAKYLKAITVEGAA